LQPGDYTITANEIKSVYTFQAEPASQTVSVVAAQTATANVNYQAITGAIDFIITGLPEGVPAGVSVDVAGRSIATAVNESQLLELLPNIYTVSADNVVAAEDVSSVMDFTYAPNILSALEVEVVAGETDVVEIAFSAITASLGININGLPEGAGANISVAGHVLNVSAIVNNLEPQGYIIDAPPVSFNGTIYVATPSSETVTLFAGTGLLVEFNYAPADGKLSVDISGLLTTVGNKVTVTGPNGFSKGLNASEMLTGLAPGVYTISAAGFTTGAANKPTCRFHFADPASQQVSVSAGQTATASVSYSSEPCDFGL
jgi:hypothetical protein